MRLADKLREKVADDFEETKAAMTKFLEDAFNKPNRSISFYFSGNRKPSYTHFVSVSRSEMTIRESDYDRVRNWLIDEGFKVRNAPVLPSVRARLEISLY